MKTYKDIVEHYKSSRKYESDTWVKHCQNANDLAKAIKRAASGDDGKM